MLKLDIDHMVPLAEASASGAWTTARRALTVDTAEKSALTTMLTTC